MKKMIFPIIKDLDHSLPYYLIGVGVDYEQEHVIRPAGYPHYQWIQCVEGNGKLKLNDNIYNINSNMGMLLYPNETHEYYSSLKSFKVNWITFDGSGISSILNVLGFAQSGIFYVSNPNIINSKIHNAFNTANINTSLGTLECSEIVYSLLLNLKSYLSSSENFSMYTQYSRLQPVIDYIEVNYNKPLTLDELAHILFITPEHLCYLFKNLFDMRPFEYINRLRINKSKNIIIKNQNVNINEISKIVGFEDHSYFSRIFKKLEGITPTQFKKMY